MYFVSPLCRKPESCLQLSCLNFSYSALVSHDKTAAFSKEVRSDADVSGLNYSNPLALMRVGRI